MASELSQLKPIEIYFDDKADEERGFYVLLTSGMPVHAESNSRYIISEKQGTMLSEKGIRYKKTD
ncbi:MAG: hypothetical protein HRF40_05425 [Nitrososphaera sp.]|jgi:hypothetical protein